MSAVVVVLTGIAALEAVSILRFVARRRDRRGRDEDAAALQRRLRAHENVSRILAEAPSSTDAAPRVTRAVADDLGWDIAVVWEVDPDGTILRIADDWAREPALQAFHRNNRHRVFARGQGFVGRAWAEARALWAEDIRRDEDFATPQEAAEAGVRTAVAVPLTSGDDVLGMLVLMGTRQRARDDEELGVLTTIGRVVGAFIAARHTEHERAAALAASTDERRRADRAERRASFLAEAGPRLSSSMEVTSTAEALLQLAVPEMADYAAVDLREPGGAVRRVAVAHVDAARERWARDVADPDEPEAAVRRALATGAPVLIPSPDPMLVTAGLIDQRQLDLLGELALESLLAVPLRSRGTLLGAITLAVGGADRSIGIEDLAVAEGLADRTAQAIVNARLLQDEREARNEAQQAALALERAQERFRTAFEHAPIGVGLISLAPEDRGRWLEVNPALCEILGYDDATLLRRSFADGTHPEDRAADEKALDALVDGTIPELRREKRYAHAAGHSVWVQVHASAVHDRDGRALHGVAQVQDITDRKHYERQLQYLADHDALTGIYNRRRFVEELDRAVTHARRYEETAAVLVIDLDNFKYVNDTYGHAIGDDLLGHVAGALRSRLRDTDVLGRLGGDEFAAILPRVDGPAARIAAADLLAAVRAGGAVTMGDRRVRATCSIGINIVDTTTRMTAEELLVEADLAMYEAKEAGRDRIASVAPGEASRAKMRARMTWSERIRDALENEHFELWEQPIRTLSTGCEDRTELLIRMLDSSGDAIPPSVFLYIAERFGQIQAVDRWVIARAIRLLAERDHILEVNLSGASITDEHTIDFIAAEIRNAPIDPTKLVFEVTETTAIVNVERARRFARRLSDLGCQFALDDFGSGFGSFYYLKHLPFDCVKIDGDFVKELPVSPADQLTVKAIVQIARGMGKETVAEFVQDEQTMALLREYGVDYAQGYHVGRPRRATRGRRPAPFRLPA